MHTINNTSKKISFGIIGCSKIARKAVLSAINSSQFAEIGRIGSRDLSKAKEFCEYFHCDNYGTYDEVLEDENIDIVYISLPNSLHEKWTIKAAKKRKHVWCEKPSTTSFISAKKMVEACKKNNVRLFEGLMFRYHPQQKLVKKIVDKGILGDLLKFFGNYSFPYQSKDSNIMNNKLGGGSLNDSASYPIYASRMLFQEEPISVLCNLNIDPISSVDVNVDILLNYPEGKTAHISSMFGSYYQCRYDLLGSNGRVVLNRAYVVPKNMQTNLFLDTEDKIKKIKIPPHDHFKLMVDDFCNEISKTRNKINHEKDLLCQARVLEAARISSREKRVVMISEIV